MTNILFFGASFNFWTIFRGLNQMFDFNPFYFDKEISNKNKKNFTITILPKSKILVISLIINTILINL